MNKIVCIIGAGGNGMTAAKACLEEGFDITVYERTDNFGGLWRYREDDDEGVGSVMRSGTINSSKEMTAFGDFPPEPELANNMHNSKVITYLEKYGNTFNFGKYVKYRHEIIEIQQNIDYDITGKWMITIKDITNGTVFEKVFDAVMICNGHHIKPNFPKFTDQHLFSGQTMHSHSYKNPDKFANKRVVVVGLGNSGADVSTDLSNIAAQVYISTRRGSWIIPRIGPNGNPIDTIFNKKITDILLKVIPFNMFCSVFEFYVNKMFDHSKYQLKPKHRILSQHGLLNGLLPNRILSGQIIVKNNIKCFTKNGVIFEGESEETLCDAVIFATGYDLYFPFLSQELVPINNNSIDLYQYVFPPKLKHPQTLGFISLVQSTGALFTVGEIQSRWFALLLNNKLKLPSAEVMVKSIEKTREKISNTYYATDRHKLEMDWMPYMEEMSAEMGIKPNYWKYFFTDPKLWWCLIFGPFVSYRFRLTGPHSWSGARDAILGVQQRIKAPFKTRNGFVNNDKNQGFNYFMSRKLIFMSLICYLLFAYLI